MAKSNLAYGSLMLKFFLADRGQMTSTSTNKEINNQPYLNNSQKILVPLEQVS